MHNGRVKRTSAPPTTMPTIDSSDNEVNGEKGPVFNSIFSTTMEAVRFGVPALLITSNEEGLITDNEEELITGAEEGLITGNEEKEVLSIVASFSITVEIIGCEASVLLASGKTPLLFVGKNSTLDVMAMEELLEGMIASNEVICAVPVGIIDNYNSDN